jgi:hypothetical protein
MQLGPITIRWTKTLKAEQAEAQVRDMRHNRCIAGQYHDIQALRGTVSQWRPIIEAVARNREAKTPKGAGVAI